MKYSKRQAVTYLTASQCSGGRFYSRVLYFLWDASSRRDGPGFSTGRLAQRHRERGRETYMYDAGMGSWGEKEEEEEEVVAH